MADTTLKRIALFILGLSIGLYMGMRLGEARVQQRIVNEEFERILLECSEPLPEWSTGVYNPFPDDIFQTK